MPAATSTKRGTLFEEYVGRSFGLRGSCQPAHQLHRAVRSPTRPQRRRASCTTTRSELSQLLVKEAMSQEKIEEEEDAAAPLALAEKGTTPPPEARW